MKGPSSVALIKTLDERDYSNSIPRLRIDWCDSVMDFILDYELALMNCVLIAGEKTSSFPAEGMDVLVIRKGERDILIDLNPDEVIDAMDVAREMFENAECYEKAERCMNVIDMWLTTASGGMFSIKTA